MTTTPTSGAADLRATFSEMLVDLPNTEPYTLFQAGFDAALAAGQATAAQQGVAYAAQQASTVTNYTTLGAAMRAIRQSIQMIGDPEDECMRAVKRVLRGAVIIVEDSGDEVAAPAAPAQPAAQQGVVYAEHDTLMHSLWLASSFAVNRYLMSNAEGRWSGAEKATCHDELCRLYVAVFRGVEIDQVRVSMEKDWIAVHDATRELTDNMDEVIGFPLKGVPDYDTLAPKFFGHFHSLATHALRASHGQASSQAGEYPALVCDYCGALTPDPWHSSGMLHGKMSKHIHSCDACAARGAPAQAAKQQEQLI